MTSDNIFLLYSSFTFNFGILFGLIKWNNMRVKYHKSVKHKEKIICFYYFFDVSGFTGPCYIKFV